MKDNFSARSDAYAKFRPVYPKQLYDFILPLVQTKSCAWDCGTGNGQVAHELAGHFEMVYATDISEKQILNAIALSNVHYKVETAEQTAFADASFDLITVAQAIHWFDFDTFYAEAKRVLKPDGIIVVTGYGLLTIDNDIDEIVTHFYNDITGKYWDTERKYIDEHYLTIPFPFDEIDAPQFYIECEWGFERLIGFLSTWSAVQHYIKANTTNPIDLIYDDLKNAWKGSAIKKVQFPVLLRIGQL